MKLKFYVPKQDKVNATYVLKSVAYYRIDGWDVFEACKIGNGRNFKDHTNLARLIEESKFFKEVSEEELALII